MALFFDLSIPFLDGDGSVRGGGTASSSRLESKDRRLKAVVRAMELGYVAVAYDRPARGVLSDADLCKIAPFPLSSLLKAAPVLAASAAFHRQLIGAPISAPFRQYTRLTVSAHGAAAVLALNGNPVLRTYDLVAVRPLNQEAFDKACESSEVDIIAMDFSQKLPFRFKLPLVKLAIQRGLHFEITYSHLLTDVHVRRQILSDARLLVDWTRGKNLIISSTASTVNEIRGPRDVANLAVSLLGLTLKRAKAAVSEHCRALVAKALRKKHFHKEAIRIERIIPEEKLESKRFWTGEWSDWDPISGGEGDLPSLDDITKVFSSGSKPSLSVSSIDFTSLSETPFLFGQNGATIPSPKKLGPSALSNDIPYSECDDAVEQGTLDHGLVGAKTSTDLLPSEQPSEQQKSAGKEVLVSPNDVASLHANDKKSFHAVEVNEHPKCCNESTMVSNATEIPSTIKILGITCMGDSDHLLSKDCTASCVLLENKELSDIGMEDQMNSHPHEMEKRLFQDRTVMKIAEQEDESLSCRGIFLQKCDVQSALNDVKEDITPSGQDNLLNGAFVDKKEEKETPYLFEDDTPSKEDVDMVEEQREVSPASNGTMSCKTQPGRGWRKEKFLHPTYPLPFKNLLKPMLLKKKRRKRKLPAKHL